MRPSALLISALLAFTAGAQNASDSTEAIFETLDLDDGSVNTDSLEATFQYQTGDLLIADGVVTLHLPDSLKFLAGDQARQLIIDLWGNPPTIADELAGVIMYADAGAYDERSAFLVYFDPIGYVSDEDADGLDYGKMLKDMLKEDSLENAQRLDAGYDALELVGWASPPFYDKKVKALHWAKEMRSEGSEDNVLNYNIRVLGRRGVIIVNGLSTMSRLEIMQREVPAMIDIVGFADGHRYEQFNAKTDEVANWSVGGLIDGKVREKMAGMLKLLLKVAAIAVVSLVAIVALIVFLIRRKKRPRSVSSGAPMS